MQLHTPHPCAHLVPSAGGFALGYSLSRGLGLPETAARSHAIQAGQRNSALAAQLALTHFAAHPLAAVPCALSACVHTGLAGVAAWYWQQHQPEGQQQGQQGGEDDSAPLPSLLRATALEAGKAVGAAAGAARTAALGVRTSGGALLERLSLLTEQQLQVRQVAGWLATQQVQAGSVQVAATAAGWQGGARATTHQEARAGRLLLASHHRPAAALLSLACWPAGAFGWPSAS